ncbi:hypothetical protein ACFFSH_39010 [Streptomyces filamentosus]|uniref:Uncharacterized protein n=1 Tax=Streptomyces filamentosus TaxID=67294 RepID=A0A919BNW9_STRFL|nr:hypothetical protein [Streptomyces filamentosus]GHG04134.1 hypothetical protein GCM10017667_38170 [Streptomyces filamentosus]
MTLLHRHHRWLGRDVEDTTTGRRGILRAIAPEGDAPGLRAWLLPVGGGTEWTTEISALANPAPISPTTRPAP